MNNEIFKDIKKDVVIFFNSNLKCLEDKYIKLKVFKQKRISIENFLIYTCEQTIF